MNVGIFSFLADFKTVMIRTLSTADGERVDKFNEILESDY